MPYEFLAARHSSTAFAFFHSSLYFCPMNPDLKAYIEQEIIPRYETFDAAHGTDHVRTVIAQSRALAAHCDVDPAMVYVVAAYHDTGLAFGREEHHLRSGEILRRDAFLRRHFTGEQIETMARAVEDHRASAQREPRSIYGRIVAEADRCLDPETVVRRTVQYSLDRYPALAREEHFARCREHLRSKYGEGGYLRLWIAESDNARRIETLRAVIRDPQRLGELFDRFYDSERRS